MKTIRILTIVFLTVASTAYGVPYLTVNNGQTVDSITVELTRQYSIEVRSDDTARYQATVGFDHCLPLGNFSLIEIKPEAGTDARAEYRGDGAFLGYLLDAPSPAGSGLHFVFQYEPLQIGETDITFTPKGADATILHITIVPRSAGSGFTYRGQLGDGGEPANGEYDFEFRLYDDSEAGSEVGNTVVADELDVIDGYFTVMLDFGDDPNVFNGEPRWLEIGVRPGELDELNAYTKLSPRHELTPTPYAIYARKAGQVDVPRAGGLVTLRSPGLVLYIPFEDADGGGGSLTKDWSGYNNDGVLGPDLTPGDYNDGMAGRAVSFDYYTHFRGDVSVNCGGAGSLDFADGFAVSAWVKLTEDCGSGAIISKIEDVGHGQWRGFAVGITDERDPSYIFRMGDGSQPAELRSNQRCQIGEWTHIAVLWDGSEAKFFINGQIDSNTPCDLYDNSARPLVIAESLWDGMDSRFIGMIDEVRAYSRTLNTTEIAALCQMGLDKNQEIGGPWVSRDDVYVDASGNVGIGTTGPAGRLEVDGIIHSTSGGFKFPNGTTQTTASAGNTLDQAYDQGGPGNGSTIIADAGAVTISGNYGLTVNGLLTVNHWVSAKAVDVTDDGIYFPDGTKQTTAATSGTGDITAVYADNGLTGGGTSGDVHLNIAAGQGISVSADAVQLSQTYATGSAYDSRFINEGQSNSIASAMIQDSAVGTDKIAGDAVTAYKLAHNIDATGIGFDADKVDGQHASGFAFAGHAHDARYYTQSESDSSFVNTTGDSMSGYSSSGLLNVTNSAMSGYGVYGKVTGPYGKGVYGEVSDSGNYSNYGGYFVAAGGQGRGVYGEASNSGAGYANYGGYFVARGGQGTGVYAIGNKYAGSFNGDVLVSGTLSKGGGYFKIDHPLDAENKYLCHSFVESPDMKNVYDGVAWLDENGEAEVELPEWFEALNRDFRYQLTCIGGFAPIYIAEKISGNRFKIAGGEPGMEVCWQVTGIRHDPYANANRIVVEQDKPEDQRGYYLHPAAYGLPGDRGIEPIRDMQASDANSDAATADDM